jgi:transposase
MTKHTEAHKLRVVEAYLKGTAGSATIAAQHGVDKATVQKWVASYRVHGAEGLKKKFSHYSAEFKLSVLRHMWENKLSCRKTAAVFDLRNHAYLTDWERRYRSGGIEALQPRQRGRPRTMPDTGSKPPPSPDEDKRSREELLSELKYLRMENAYLKKLKALVQAKEAPAKRK